MADHIHEYFQIASNCYSDLCLARQTFSNTKTSEEQYDQMEKTLGLMYLHCPADLQNTTLATIKEAEERRFYFIKTWNNS